MLVLVLQNEVAAMTGGQAVPDLRKVVEAITPDVSVFDIDASEEEEAVDGTSKVIDETKKRADKTEEATNKTEKVTDKAENEIESGNEIEKTILNPKLSELILAKLALPGLSVIFIKGKCRKYCSGVFC